MTPRECYQIARDIRVAFKQGSAAQDARNAWGAAEAFDTTHANAAFNTLQTLQKLCPKINGDLYLKRCGL